MTAKKFWKRARRKVEICFFRNSSKKSRRVNERNHLGLFPQSSLSKVGIPIFNLLCVWSNFLQQEMSEVGVTKKCYHYKRKGKSFDVLLLLNFFLHLDLTSSKLCSTFCSSVCSSDRTFYRRVYCNLSQLALCNNFTQFPIRWKQIQQMKICVWK